MGTDKPEIQGYILPKLYDRFEEWKRELEITKDSQALNQLFSEFFSLSPTTWMPKPGGHPPGLGIQLLKNLNLIS